MSNGINSDLNGFSQALTSLVKRSSAGVAAVKGGAYRVASGVLLRDGLLATANHTLRREDPVPIQAGGRDFTATVLGRDPSIDLAILKADGLDGAALPAANPGELKPGMLIAVIGMTIDVGASASLGILGAVGAQRRTWRGGTLDQFLRLDVNLYPSQSGAAVVTAAGELIGMATPALSRHSTIVIPLATVQRVADELKQQGRIRRGYLGVGLQPVRVTESLRSKAGNAESGLIVLSIEPDSPAEAAKLQIGDILLSLNGHGLSDIEDLQGVLRGEIVGRGAQVHMLRGGEPLQVTVTVAERGKDA